MAQFKPGQSGNPRGRKPRIVEDAGRGLLARLFDAAAEERVIRAMIEAAASGDVSAYRALDERKHGKVTDKIEEKSETVIRVEYVD